MEAAPLVATPRSKGRTALGAAARRAQTSTGTAAAFLYGGLLVGVVAADDGGFFPVAWGWVAVATLGLAIFAFLLRERVSCSTTGAVFVLGLLAFAAWSALSMLWTQSGTSTMHEVQHDLAYVGIALAATAIVSRRAAGGLLAGALAGIWCICAYAVAVRLLPGRLLDYDPTQYGYRLTDPVGYWNGVGIFAAMGALLALGLAGRSRSVAGRTLAAAALPLLTLAVYFTFSRGAWAALGVGLAVAIALDPRRLQLAAATLAVGAPAAVAVLLAQRQHALTTAGAPFVQASDQGHRLLVDLLWLSLASAGAGAGFALAERYLPFPRLVRTTFALLLLAAVAAGLAVAWARIGSPVTLAERSWHSFRSPPAHTGRDLPQRLLQFSNNGRISLWTTSWQGFQAHPLLGTGAGTFWERWAANPKRQFDTTQGHSLYMTALGELGLPGLLLLLTALCAPLVALVRRRRAALAPVAGAAYVAWLAHTGIDWDWKLVGVSLVAVLCATALAAQEPERFTAGMTRSRVAAACATAVLLAAVIPSLVADLEIRSGRKAVEKHPAAALRDAASALRFAPWSSEAYYLRAQAYATQHRKPAATAALDRAASLDRSNWHVWQSLAAYTRGAVQIRARARLEALNPHAHNG